jgi:hypothetical protein
MFATVSETVAGAAQSVAFRGLIRPDLYRGLQGMNTDWIMEHAYGTTDSFSNPVGDCRYISPVLADPLQVAVGALRRSGTVLQFCRACDAYEPTRSQGLKYDAGDGWPDDQGGYHTSGWYEAFQCPQGHSFRDYCEPVTRSPAPGD